MADELNGYALAVHHTNLYKKSNFQNDGTSWYFGVTLNIGLGLFFPVVCFVRVFGRTLAEQLYHGKGLVLACEQDLLREGGRNRGGIRRTIGCL